MEIIANEFDFSIERQAKLAQVAIYDQWLAFMPLSSNEYLVIRKWFNPKGFVLTNFLFESAMYSNDVWFEKYVDAMLELCWDALAFEDSETA